MKAELAAALDAMRTGWRAAQVHEVGKVPASPVTPYAVVSVSTPGSGNVNLAGQWGSKSFRVVIQCFGKSLNEVAAPVEAAESAFLSGPLHVDGWDTAPVDPSEVVSSQILRDPDDAGLLGCTLIYPMTAFPKE